MQLLQDLLEFTLQAKQTVKCLYCAAIKIKDVRGKFNEENEMDIL